ncbi:hypothetical protein DSL72_007418 [Monilinia vaccinii-corymbosi]|uniref:Uncharacterized protein n=1 Tax=Monilinia vaccinii-corymbosi TaxID=61207 RepID=A0A8A3PLJ8_9HELO|nr:hypothetical protein DSL72_007418 [Monilinia vaccinii-corymbosi]
MSRFFSHESHLNVQQPQRNSTIVVPLVKFSCSLTHQGSTTGSQWTHYSRNDLELVIQEVQVEGSQCQNESASHLVMKVVAGAEYLEEQNLEEIATISKNFTPLPGIEIPVRVVVKQPLLALRYPKSHNVCRLQFRFRDNSGFNQVVNILAGLGLAATESISSGPPLQFRPSTVNSNSSGLSMASSTPTTSCINSSQNAEFKVPMRPDSASSIIQRSSSSCTFQSDSHPFSRPQSAMSISSFMPQSKPSIEPLKRAQSLYVSQLEREPQEIQPSIYVAPSPNNTRLSHDTHGNRVLLPKPEESQRLFTESPLFEPRAGDHLSSGSTLSSSVNGTIKYKSYEHGTVPDGFGSLENRPLSLPTDYPTFSALAKRPMSLPTEHDIFFGLPIPPKRQLPFSTAKGSLKLAPITPEIANFTVQAVNRLKRPLEDDTLDNRVATEVSTSTKTSNKRLAASRKGIIHLPEAADSPSRMFPSTKRLGGYDGLDISVQTEESSSFAAKSFDIPTAPGLPSKLQLKGVAVRQPNVSTPPSDPKPLKMVDGSTQTQTLSGRDHTAALQPTHSASALQPSSKSSTALEPPPLLQKDMDSFLSEHSSRSKISLPSNYSDVPDDVRHKMLNDFIVANLENEDFLKLAEDMEASLRRIGLTR